MTVSLIFLAILKPVKAYNTWSGSRPEGDLKFDIADYLQNEYFKRTI